MHAGPAGARLQFDTHLLGRAVLWWVLSRAGAMRDMASKMAELKFEAPLAQFEETDEWGSTEFQSATLKNENELNNINLNMKNKELNEVLNDFNEDILNNDNSNTETLTAKNGVLKNGDTASVADNFTETFSGSLEDLVNTFDEKITKCFGNYEESVEKLAPVQVRTQEEIMNECQWVVFWDFSFSCTTYKINTNFIQNPYKKKPMDQPSDQF